MGSRWDADRNLQHMGHSIDPPFPMPRKIVLDRVYPLSYEERCDPLDGTSRRDFIPKS